MITTYGSGTTTTPSGVAPTVSTADIVSFLPTGVNGLGFQDYNRSGRTILGSSIAAGASKSVESPSLQAGLKGVIIDINGLYDAVESTSGIQIYTLYSVNNGSTYTSQQLMATTTGRKLECRVYIEYRTALISNIRFIFTNLDTVNPCQMINVTASMYR